MNLSKPDPITRTISFRKWKTLNTDKLKLDLKTCLSNIQLSDHNCLEQITNDITSSLDTHVPIIKKLIRMKNSAPWFNKEIINARRLRRKLETIARKSTKVLDHLAYVKQRDLTNKIISDAKYHYYKNFVAENSQDPTSLWSFINTLLQKKQKTTLPNYTSASICADKFSDYFISKIRKIRDSFSSSCANHELKLFNNEFSDFTMTTNDDILKLLKSAKHKSCQLDFAPTWLIKKFGDIFAPLFCQIVNLSLSSASIPKSQKKAVITPLLKKPSFNKEVLSNYRPVSGLSFLSKRVIFGRVITRSNQLAKQAKPGTG